jgi:hypothetical protein
LRSSLNSLRWGLEVKSKLRKGFENGVASKLRKASPILSVTDTEPMPLPSALTAPASYLRRRLISCKRHRTNSTLSGSVRSFAGRADWRTRKEFLANPRASNAGPTVSSPITQSRFTTRLKISVEEGNEKWGRISSAQDRKSVIKSWPPDRPRPGP